MRALFFFLFIPCMSLFSADFSAQLELPQKQATLFETVPLQLVLNYPKGYSVDPARLKNNLLQTGDVGIPPFHVEQVGHDLKESGDVVTESFVFQIEPETLGKKTLTFWKISFQPPAGKEPAAVFSPWVDLEILPPEEKVKEPLIAPLLPLSETLPVDLSAENRYALLEREAQEPLRNQNLFADRQLAWLGWLVLGLGALFLWWFRPIKDDRRREKEKDQAKAQLKQSLKDLQEAIQKGDLEDFYERLMTHIRLFYEQFEGRRVETLTTEEFLEQASPGVRAVLEDILRIGDQVRFGKLPASKESAQKALDIALREFGTYR